MFGFVYDPARIRVWLCFCLDLFSLFSREMDATLDLANADNMPLAQFLCCLRGMSEESLMKQVIGQLSALMDEIWSEKNISRNPWDIEENELSVARRSRRDVVLSDKLALGEGLWERWSPSQAPSSTYAEFPDIFACCSKAKENRPSNL